jgi:hypothetical protein
VALSSPPSQFLGSAFMTSSHSSKDTASSESAAARTTTNSTTLVVPSLLQVEAKATSVLDATSIPNATLAPVPTTNLNSSVNATIYENRTTTAAQHDDHLFGLHNFKDNWDPHKKSDFPVFWHIPKSGVRR